MRSVGIEARHDHDLPRQVPYKTRRAEHRLTKPAETLHHEAESGLGTPACICGVQERVTEHHKCAIVAVKPWKKVFPSLVCVLSMIIDNVPFSVRKQSDTEHLHKADQFMFSFL